MIIPISTPEYSELSPPITCRWLATESPNNFRLLRKDWLCSGVDNGGFLELTCVDDYTGAITNDIACYCSSTNQMYIGKVTNIDGTLKIVTTDIHWVSSMATGMVSNITYMNDNTLHGGYYFEGQLTINGVVYPLTIIASPDTFGYADLDVSGILRIVTSLGKVGDYSARIMKEPTKSGMFTLEYRECWYGSDGTVITSPMVSPPIWYAEGNIWYYGECVRSEEQGSNLHDYVASSVNDAPFLNQFDQPVYFLGLPFDLSFILPETVSVSPSSDITITICVYNANGTLLDPDPTNSFTYREVIPADSLEGFICSLAIDPTIIPSLSSGAYLTAEINL
jgi:hypothetical protein